MRAHARDGVDTTTTSEVEMVMINVGVYRGLGDGEVLLMRNVVRVLLCYQSPVILC